jgi:hypothetical protein
MAKKLFITALATVGLYAALLYFVPTANNVAFMVGNFEITFTMMALFACVLITYKAVK